MTKEELNVLHKHSYGNDIEIMSSSLCGCFYCGKLFKPSKIKDFIKEKDNQRTAHCPYCGVDSVISDFAVSNLNSEILKEMHDEFF